MGRSILLPAFALISCLTAPETVVCKEHVNSSRELVFRGTIVRVQQGLTADRDKNFVITTRVDKVLSGSFSGKQFQFAVHSPAQSNLDLGKQYTIHATRTETGYMVDELQWIRAAAERKSR